ncbi:hypothetical protein [Ezakiella coagulans]|uniref:hypothetical protein n=1 Tax=Ezakiella coagulans TaxID=46507 RepID=UPI0010582C44|nr:hypothetical protein [Ezakiella coagulans]
MRAYSQGKDKKISNIISIDNDFLIGSLRQKICSRKSHTSQAKRKKTRLTQKKEDKKEVAKEVRNRFLLIYITITPFLS